MKHYVKVIDGQVVQRPRPLSSSEQESPNIHWGPEQLRLNGYVIVDISYDVLSEDIDLDNPIVNGNSVSYNRITLSNEEKSTRRNADVDIKRKMEYPSTEELVVALWELIIESNSTMSAEIQSRREAIKAKYPKETE